LRTINFIPLPLYLNHSSRRAEYNFCCHRGRLNLSSPINHQGIGDPFLAMWVCTQPSCSVLLICLFFCSTYDIEFLLDALANSLCPSYFPPGQECTLPLNPGEYGSLVGGPMDFTFGDISDIQSKLKLTFTASNENQVCSLVQYLYS